MRNHDNHARVRPLFDDEFEEFHDLESLGMYDELDAELEEFERRARDEVNDWLNANKLKR